MTSTTIETDIAGSSSSSWDASTETIDFDAVISELDVTMGYDPHASLDTNSMGEMFEQDTEMVAACNAKWTTGELLWHGIIEMEEIHRGPQDLHFLSGPWCDLNDVHPIFAWAPGKWLYKDEEGFFQQLSFIVWQSLLPAWALASKQLTTSSSMGDFWTVLAAGEFPEDPVASGTIKWPAGTRQDQQRERDDVLAALATRIKFCFGHAASCWGYCSQVFTPWNPEVAADAQTHPLLVGSTTHWPYIELSDRYLNTAMSWLGLRVTSANMMIPPPTTQQMIRCNLMLSSTACHEIAHALTGQRRNEPESSGAYGSLANGETEEPSHPLRPQLPGHVRIREMGSVWEDITFGFRMHDLSEVCISDNDCEHAEGACICSTVAHYGLLADCSSDYGSSTQMAVPRKYLPVPMSWVGQWFRKSFWANLEAGHHPPRLDIAAPVGRWVLERDGKRRMWRDECYRQILLERGDPWEVAEAADWSLRMYTPEAQDISTEVGQAFNLTTLEPNRIFQG